MKNLNKKSLLVIALISSTALIAAPKDRKGRPPLAPQQQFRQINRQILSSQDQAAFNTTSSALNIALNQYSESAPPTVKKMYKTTIIQERANLEHFINTYTESAQVQSTKDLLDRAKQFIKDHPKDTQSSSSRQAHFEPSGALASAPASASTPAPTPAPVVAPASIAAYVLITEKSVTDNKGYPGMTSWIRDDEEFKYWGDRQDHKDHIAALQLIVSK